MSTIGEIIKRKQPKIYRKLMAMCPDVEDKDTKKDAEASFRETENLMRHDGYVRGRGGAIKQVRRG